MGNKVSLEENLIDLKIVSKQMLRSAQKCEQNEKAAINKLKKVSSNNAPYISRRSDRESYSFLASILDFKHIECLDQCRNVCRMLVIITVTALTVSLLWL